MEASLTGHEDGFLLTVVSRKLEQGRSIKRYWINSSRGEDLPEGMDKAFRDLILKTFPKAEQSGFINIDLSTIPDHQVKIAIMEHIKPMPQLIIVGGGHVGKALAHLGSLLEFEISVLDDRADFANKIHIPDADHVIVSEVGAALEKMNPGPESYIVIVTRGHRLDGEALKACIGSEAAYIGMIGSRNKVAIMKRQFMDQGWASPEQWAAVHTPIGLSIGSVSVQEIAVSIAAQLIEVRNRKRNQ
jgi:xanthine dehydrogenase accessory factor